MILLVMRDLLVRNFQVECNFNHLPVVEQAEIGF